MSYLEKLYYNMDRLSGDYTDNTEVDEARENVKDALGEKTYFEHENKILILASAHEKQGFMRGFQYAVALLTNAKSNTGSLEEVMRNEYDAMSFMDAPMPKDHKKAMSIIRSKFTQKEFLKVEEMLMGSYVEAEKFGFEQGFMRGIVVAKGGAV